MGNLLGSPVTDKETHVGETACGIKYGVSSMQGWRIHMEDAHICEPRLYAEEPAPGEDGTRFNKIEIPDHSLFAVFDGHGGSFAAVYAGLNLCRVLSRQPSFVQYAKFAVERPQREPTLQGAAARAEYVRSGLQLLETALHDTFVEIDREILMAVQGSPVSDANIPYHEPTETQSLSLTPSEIPAELQPNDDEDAGTTAVVVILTPHWVVCANAGDSRAVFSKHGRKAVPLSYDHKPDDEEEERRIRAAGGYVAGGRVEGDLAVSRGLGDYRFKVLDSVLAGSSHLRQESKSSEDGNDGDHSMLLPDDQKVTPVPDIIVQNRNADQDEFIIVACDGIWDVQTNYECVKTCADIFAEGETDMGLLCEELLDICLSMGSKDNMTALMIKFDAQKIGEGGGVRARRALREEAEAKDQNHKEHNTDQVASSEVMNVVVEEKAEN